MPNSEDPIFVSSLFKENMGERAETFLKGLGKMAADYGVGCYLVGGLVRDILLGGSSPDIDVMVTSDLTGFLNYAIENWNNVLPGFSTPERPSVFKKFFTAKLKFKEELLDAISAIDFSQARTEVYPKPGDRPTVSPGSFLQDMERRDFSVNALAVNLVPDSFGRLEDLTGGLGDLHQSKLRLLHNKSLLEDPARILRGIRLEQRLSFCFEEQTLSQFSEAIRNNYLAKLPPFRLFDETLKALNEFHPWKFLLRASSLGVFSQIFQGSEFTSDRVKTFCQFLEVDSSLNKLSSEDLYALCFSRAMTANFRAWLMQCNVSEKRQKKIIDKQVEYSCNLNF